MHWPDLSRGQVAGRWLTSSTTSRSSASISFSARKKRCQSSSPILPRCNSWERAGLAFLTAMIRRMSSHARCRRAALRTESGTFGAFSCPGPGSRWSRERYTLRCRWAGNQGSRLRDDAIPGQRSCPFPSKGIPNLRLRYSDENVAREPSRMVRYAAGTNKPVQSTIAPLPLRYPFILHSWSPPNRLPFPSRNAG